MTLPPSAHASAATVSTTVPVNIRSAQRTILLVEDEPFVRQATCSILESAGFAVLSAEDARDAMKVYEDCHCAIDLVMTDMVLPGGSGQQLGQDLQRRSPEVVVLVTSGYSDREDDLEAPESRTYFLAKPYSKRALVDKIEKILAAASLAHITTQAV